MSLLAWSWCPTWASKTVCISPSSSAAAFSTATAPASGSAMAWPHCARCSSGLGRPGLGARGDQPRPPQVRSQPGGPHELPCCPASSSAYRPRVPRPIARRSAASCLCLRPLAWARLPRYGRPRRRGTCRPSSTSRRVRSLPFSALAPPTSASFTPGSPATSRTAGARGWWRGGSPSVRTF